MGKMPPQFAKSAAKKKAAGKAAPAAKKGKVPPQLAKKK